MKNKFMVGDLVYLDPNRLDICMVMDTLALNNGNTLIKVISLYNDNGYDGWFNSNKVNLILKVTLPKYL